MPATLPPDRAAGIGRRPQPFRRYPGALNLGVVLGVVPSSARAAVPRVWIGQRNTNQGATMSTSTTARAGAAVAPSSPTLGAWLPRIAFGGVSGFVLAAFISAFLQPD